MFDFRSDTVTQPTAAMREAMATAVVGDDVYGDDPTVNKLEQMAAERYGFDAAIFCSSGTQANLLAIMAHCQRGDEYICGQNAHNYRWEGGGAAVLGSVQPQPIANEADGSICLQAIRDNIKPDDDHHAKTKLLSLENTIGGKVLSLEYLAQAQALAFEHGLRIHLDGARVFNAAVKLNVDASEITQYFDSVSICLSKGLAAPVGSLLLGSESLIRSARRWRKMLGGGMRQAGILAAAGILALDEQIDKLAIDHEKTQYLAHQLLTLTEFTFDLDSVQTNMIFTQYTGKDGKALSAYLRTKGIIISASNAIRFVVHQDITVDAIDLLITEIKHFHSM
ncbi:low-specificity L-threonine aldolase [Moritella yayanosii]|uniref:L-allo-threonine aldolase, PLP-dependent n=1 Tax=Moritella yayanosii TaxID=69539 RepID=A0A330LPG5_9GAMM|nr:low-specificity L-threonine aldolase [Moritella yayanosii]SQD78593.1 L-allo-threonine aldolase, PLP-dependent [Moritella yayanosii]